MSTHYIKQGDRRPAIPVVLKHGDTIVDLTLATSVTAKLKQFRKVDLTVDAAATITTAADGEVEYRWAVGDTATAGTYYLEWEVIWSDGTPETFPTNGFDIVIIRDDLDGS